ncbi:MAG: N-methyl-D-aspartate receptor NMDAR2C subunit [Betaproteobacteria bacterium]
MTADDFIARHQSDWHAVWQSLAHRQGHPELLDALVARYAEPHRHYHTLQHLDACLRHLPSLAAQATRPDEIAIALWLHDAVYVIGAADNELCSANLARDLLLTAGVDAATTERVHALIMATRHDQAPQSRDQEILLDVDLGILGARAAVFDGYEQQIRAEYRSVPEPQFRANRRRILQGFLARARIYHTQLFFERYEAPARANLARSISALGGL